MKYDILMFVFDLIPLVAHAVIIGLVVAGYIRKNKWTVKLSKLPCEILTSREYENLYMRWAETTDRESLQTNTTFFSVFGYLLIGFIEYKKLLPAIGLAIIPGAIIYYLITHWKNGSEHVYDETFNVKVVDKYVLETRCEVFRKATNGIENLEKHSDIYVTVAVLSLIVITFLFYGV